MNWRQLLFGVHPTRSSSDWDQVQERRKLLEELVTLRKRLGVEGGTPSEIVRRAYFAIPKPADPDPPEET